MADLIIFLEKDLKKTVDPPDPIVEKPEHEWTQITKEMEKIEEEIDQVQSGELIHIFCT